MESTSSTFHALLDSLSDQDLRRKSNNPGWSNGEILFHMAFAFMILSALIPLVKFFGHLPESYSRLFAGMLNSFTWVFNWINAVGARGGGRVYTGRNIGKKYDKVYNAILKKLASIKENEWQSGMYYPTRWDALFSEYMTLEKLFHYPVSHFQFHLKQISRPT
ncbi:MAG: DinB family protein [Dehalococcoidales bacterium]|nr:DinB family protein [Dehalococcoidales bacterium]